MAEEKKYTLPHTITLDERQTLNITGVTDIDSFDEETVVIYTECGELAIKGTGLHINKIDVEEGNLSVEGEVHSLEYSNNMPNRGGFFSKIFR